MGYRKEFDDIRPYRDQEVPTVIERLKQDPAFFTMMKFVHPEWSADYVNETITGITTIAEFQEKVAYPSMRILIDKTVKDVTVSGLDNLKDRKSHLFISNHRDIILDSAILNVVLVEAKYGTIYTAIGNNLLSSDLITDLTKLNKNFVVKRNTTAREFYENSILLSAFISYTITDLQNSIWIAQREGRTKDGLDKTQPGLLKMLSINCDKTFRECFSDLNITPVAISYEHDPCDILKIPELKAISRDDKYEKAQNEDYNSIITGLTGNKGRVHISIGKTIDKELDSLPALENTNDKLKVLGEIIDNQIHQNYKLWPTNILAYDILENKVSEKPAYEGIDPVAFEADLDKRLKAAGLTTKEDKEWLLKMYANPVKNHYNELDS
jgi:1-acyl-sn-glycerol-3-phosphate acyltransferase